MSDSKYCLYNAQVFTGYSNIQNGGLLVEQGKIVDVFNEYRFQFIPKDQYRFIDLKGYTLAPGFIDTHIHGIEGYGIEDNCVESFLKMSESLVKYGVTSFCPTIYPQEDKLFLSTLKHGRDAMGKEKGATILGLHLEGPFISSEKLGVQLPNYLKNPSIDLMKHYIQVSGGHIISMTVAPELKNMHDLALFCVNHNILLQAGHTNAHFSHMLEGFQCGILHSTHLFNAMSPLNHRDPGAVGAILLYPEVSCEIIADNFHVQGQLIHLLLKLKSENKLVLVTDALKPTMQKQGNLVANGEDVFFDGKVFRRSSDSVIAGSALTMIKGISNLCADNISLFQAIRMASTNPAEILGLNHRGALLPGYWADMCVFDQNFQIRATIINGHWVYDQLNI